MPARSKAGVAAYDEIAADPAPGSRAAGSRRVRAGAAPGRHRAADRSAPAAGADWPQPDRTFRHTARELLALSAWRASDPAAVKRWFDLITTDPETPAATRARAEMLMALVAAEAGKS